MPPADNNTPAPDAPAPAPTPAPAPEKKQGFFAKLFSFGKKKDEAIVIPPQESHTPPPQLDDPSLPPSDVPAGSPDGDSGGPEPAEPVPTVEADDNPPTLAVPPSLQTEAIQSDDEEVSPTMAILPPASANSSDETPAQAPPVGTPANPEPEPTSDSEDKQ